LGFEGFLMGRDMKLETQKLTEGDAKLRPLG
jgi:hypothetical protein